MVLLTNKNDGEAEASLSDLAAAILDATYGLPAGLQALRLALQERGFVRAAAVYATLRIDAGGFIDVHLGGDKGVEGGVKIPPLPAADGEQRALFARLGPDVGGAGIVCGMGRVGEVDHRFPGLGLGQQRGHGLGQKGCLRRRIGLAEHGRVPLVGVAQPVQEVRQPRDGVRGHGSSFAARRQWPGNRYRACGPVRGTGPRVTSPHKTGPS